MEKVKYIVGNLKHAQDIRNYFNSFDPNAYKYYSYESDDSVYYINPVTGLVERSDTDEWQFNALVKVGVFEELKYPYVKPKLQVIQGVPDRGDEVIAFLESMGGKNSGLSGRYDDSYYFINNFNEITCYEMSSDFFKDADLEILSLPNKVESKPKLQVIQGVPGRGDEVIAFLESRGGKNIDYLEGVLDGSYYFVDGDGDIVSHEMTSSVFNGYELEVLTLPEKVEKPAESVVSIYPNEKPLILEPFVTKVLVRNDKRDRWIAGIFANKYDGIPCVNIVGSANDYSEWIPYQGNEHLAYTSKDVRIE